MSLQSAVKIEVVSNVIYLLHVHQVIFFLLENSFLGIYKLGSKPAAHWVRILRLWQNERRIRVLFTLKQVAASLLSALST